MPDSLSSEDRAMTAKAKAPRRRGHPINQSSRHRRRYPPNRTSSHGDGSSSGLGFYPTSFSAELPYLKDLWVGSFERRD